VTPVIVVAAAIIERDGRFLLTRRLKGTHLEGLWEFPGGKCEPGESIKTCLSRELREELNVDGTVGDEIVVSEHAYPERTVRLHFLACTIDGDPRPLLGQEIRWVSREELRTLELPEADTELVGIIARGSDRGQTPVSGV
jgi:8-oxo-dGTP diphosphatase